MNHSTPLPSLLGMLTGLAASLRWLASDGARMFVVTMVPGTRLAAALQPHTATPAGTP